MTDTPQPGHQRISRAMSWLLSGVVLVGAWFVVADTPTRDQIWAPFDVKVSPGQWGEGRNIAARVVDATFSDHVESTDWAASGNWLVVQIEASAVVEAPAGLSYVELSVDGVAYGATNRASSGFESPLLVGVPLAGSVAFELPADVPAVVAELRLGLNPDERLDSVVVVPIDLATTPRVRTTTLVLPPTVTL